MKGYRSENFPDGIDNDSSQYIASLVKQERGFSWSLNDMIYGNQEKKRNPSKVFINEIEQYEGLKDIMFGIESLINKRSSHASGVLLNNEDPYEYACYMRTPKGEVITQWDLHDLEWAGGLKMDYLVTEITDKIVLCIELMRKHKVVEDLSIKEIYNKYLHPKVIDTKDNRIWDNLRDGKVLDVFQFSENSGLDAAKKINPRNISEMSQANAAMRLMPIDKNSEIPIEKYSKMKRFFPDSWYNEMKKYHLTEEEIETIKPLYEPNYGFICLQEDFMRILLDYAKFSLSETNKSKSIVAKKKVKEIPEFKKKFFDAFERKEFAQYLWDTGILPQLGYAFNKPHTCGYSYVGLQSLVLATKWNPVYWNTACLIVNSGALEDAEIEDSDNDEYTNDDEEKKKKERATDYGKIAKALGQIIQRGIDISLVDINKSLLTFEPDEKNNTILFGMKGLSRINNETVNNIIEGRPYRSFNDFLNRCHLNKAQMVSLIKSGAFDSLEIEWAKELNIEPRLLIMVDYLYKVSEPKTRISLQNFNGLINNNILPEEFNLQKELFKLNKEIKSMKRDEYYVLNNKILQTFDKLNLDTDMLEYDENIVIKQKTWEKFYEKQMDEVREWMKNNTKEILDNYNYLLFKSQWDKYATGNISAWEMESLCFYYHEHELVNVNKGKYGIVDFSNLPEEPEIEYLWRKTIPIYKISRIIGTVIGKNDTKSSISLLTTKEVINVKFSKEYYALMNRQISEIQIDGTKKVIEAGWFKRGNKVLVQGYKKGDTFICKTYSKTVGHQLYLIEKVLDDGTLELRHERKES